MTTEYTVWVDKGQALLGEFQPARTTTPQGYTLAHAHLKLKVGPPDILTNEMSIFFWEESDMVTTAKTLRSIVEAIERTLYPELEPDWGNIPGGEGGRW